MTQDKKPFMVAVEIPVSWGDLDAFQHVNNTVYFQWFETARIRYFEEIGFLDHLKATGVGPILAETSCKFRLPLTYPDTVTASAQAMDLGHDRFTMRYRVHSAEHGRLAAEGEGRIVCFDYRGNNKAPLPDPIRKAIETLEARR
ncbi:MAG TPA: acyl-CoA thioesterase [Deltaproteobacteria bacterium]|nr:thioesterase [Deltaproteobacteria bacterium]HCP44944.1 acyl-CoA thioesterase [Deltaproteobacteria bacterium]|tara:strand:+ start:576 stop:1007 length:432 start_codon:yes stop_codon:yes gene_type:complete